MHLRIKIINPTIKHFYQAMLKKQKEQHELYENCGHQAWKLQQDAGFDLYCPKEVTALPGETIWLDLGIACEAFTNPCEGIHGTPCPFYIYARSSISKTPLRLANNVGIIDAGYRGHLILALDNIKQISYTISKGQRLAQICAPNLETIEFEIVPELSKTQRGSGGFGSTGS